MSKEIAIKNEILRGIIGSTCHGTAIEGQDDRDEMGVFIEPPMNVCGLRTLDHYIQRDQPEGCRSQPGDLDLTLYSLRRFCELASKGNPSVVVLLWLTQHLVKTSLGEELVSLRAEFISKESGKRFLGYLSSQKLRLTGERARNVIRPDLVEKYGYDTKFAMHALRLGFEGIELLTDGKLTLPVREPDLSVLRAVRTGQIKFEEAIRLIEETEDKLKVVVDNCTAVVNMQRINEFMISAHRRHWGWNS